MFAPALPSDLLVNFYINLNKLCLTVYQLHALQPNSTKVSTPATRPLPCLPSAPQPCSPLSPGPDLCDALCLELPPGWRRCAPQPRGHVVSMRRGAGPGHPRHPNPLHLRGWGPGWLDHPRGPSPLPPVSGAHSVWR